MDEDRLIRKADTSIVKSYPEGSILMDAPEHDSMADLIAMAGDHGTENHQEFQAIGGRPGNTGRP